ncbi:MAG: hypothetical protein QOG80_1178, partial [Pseudonocardiales bacterium]|nr:hypothetical protein [Pseudonocardiales bacterium]
SLRRLGLQEVLRAAIVDALISATSSPPAAGLGELADSAPDPWRTILAEHLEVMRSLATDVSALFGFEQRSLNDFLA